MTNNQSYSIRQNVRYCAKLVVSRTGYRYYLPAIFTMLATALSPFAAAFFPSTLISLLTEKADVKTVFLTVLGFVVFFGTLTLISSLGATWRDRTLLHFRVKDSSRYQKIFTFSYAYLESKQAAVDWQEANRAHGSGSGQGIEKTVQCPIDIAGALLCILLYAGVTAALHPFLVLVLLSCSCVQAIAISRNIPCQKKSWESIYRKESDYMLAANQCTSIKAAKDIRSYQLSDWFHEKNQSFTRKIEEEKFRLHKREFVIQTIGRAAMLLRDIICYGYLIWRMTRGMDLASFTLYLSIFSGFTGYFEEIVQRY